MNDHFVEWARVKVHGSVLCCTVLLVLQEYAKDQAAFFTDFTNAYIKLSELGQV